MSEKLEELSVNTTLAASELVSDFLIEEGAQGITLDKEQSENETIIKAYFFENEINENNLINRLNNYLNMISSQGINTGKREVIVNPVEEQDWISNSQKHFEVFKVGKNLVIKPLWQDYSAQDNEVVINFDPGGFFGSTPHPSTRLCLEEIEEIAEKINNSALNKETYNILDLGSGSGILSQALYSLGLKKITAIDIDPVAIRASDDNFKLNKMDIKLFLGELKDCTETYDLIAGNLLAEIIIDLAGEISEKLNKDGIFICAGITRLQENSVIESLKRVGINITNKRYKDEWVLIQAIKA